MGRKVYEGKVIDVSLEEVRLPNGVTTELEVIGHPGGAAVVALNERGEVCLLRQYRHVVGGWLWELPAGKIDHREPPLATAKRELEEEAGVRAACWSSLGRMVSSPGVFCERVYLYLAEKLTLVTPRTEVDEVIEVHWVPFAQALARAEASSPGETEIWDAKSALAILRAGARRGAATPAHARGSGLRLDT